MKPSHNKDQVSIARRPMNQPAPKNTTPPPAASAPAAAPAAATPSDRDALYREAKAADEELKRLLASGKGQLDKSVSQVRNRLRQHYEAVHLSTFCFPNTDIIPAQLIFLDYDFAQQKDIELQLWKNGFYKVC